MFIHDYQSESAAASDWDLENGTSFSSYTPTALKQSKEMTYMYNSESSLSSQPESQPTPQDEFHNDEPLITYNEEESVDFSGFSDTTAGALLF